MADETSVLALPRKHPRTIRCSLCDRGLSSSCAHRGAQGLFVLALQNSNPLLHFAFDRNGLPFVWGGQACPGGARTTCRAAFLCARWRSRCLPLCPRSPHPPQIYWDRQHFTTFADQVDALGNARTVGRLGLLHCCHCAHGTVTRAGRGVVASRHNLTRLALPPPRMLLLSLPDSSTSEMCPFTPRKRRSTSCSPRSGT